MFAYASSQAIAKEVAQQLAEMLFSLETMRMRWIGQLKNLDRN